MMLHLKSFVAVYTRFFFFLSFSLSFSLSLSSPSSSYVCRLCPRRPSLFNNAWIDVTCISPVIQVLIWGLSLEKAGGYALCRLNLINSCHFIITMRRVISHFLFSPFVSSFSQHLTKQVKCAAQQNDWKTEKEREREREKQANRPNGESLLSSKGHVTTWVAKVNSKIVSDPPS